ncbi:hypothetical protein KIW84_040506 [Lathyrus oleraceus]|uniref:Uncharacterized protein n=1 Tax=Pisum sativum TaxID=3888 RepID=A0A9D4X7N8_PEA|nr:hypothetical protein KIW84_040506 [Pisum sativum]
MHIALILKNKENFIDDSLTKSPVADPLYAPWIRCNTMVLAWLHRSISEAISKSVLWIDSVVGVWKNLQTRFSHSDLFHISDIQEDLYKMRQGLNEKFTHSKSQIMMMNPLPDIDKVFSLVIQQEREMHNSIAAMNPTATNTEETMAFQIQTNSGNSYGKPNYSKGKTQGFISARGHNRVCSHCGRTNHNV